MWQYKYKKSKTETAGLGEAERLSDSVLSASAGGRRKRSSQESGTANDYENADLVEACLDELEEVEMCW